MAIGGIETTLLSIHTMAAAFFKAPEMELAPNEARALAEAFANVSRYYPMPGLKPEHAALSGLAVTIFVVYRPKLAAIAQRRGTEKTRNTETPAHVVGGMNSVADFIPPQQTEPPAWFVAPMGDKAN